MQRKIVLPEVVAFLDEKLPKEITDEILQYFPIPHLSAALMREMDIGELYHKPPYYVRIYKYNNEIRDSYCCPCGETLFTHYYNSKKEYTHTAYYDRDHHVCGKFANIFGGSRTVLKPWGTEI